MRQLKMKQKNKNEVFLERYQAFQGPVFLRNLLTGKGTIRAGEGTTRAGESF